MGTSRSRRDKKKFSPHHPQTVTSALRFPHIWLTQTSCPARFISFFQDETRSLVQSSAPPPWHCVPDDVILVSRAFQTGCWWYKQSAGEGQDAFKAIWVCRLLCWKPPSLLNVTRQHTRKAHICVHNLMHSYRGSPPCLYGRNQTFKKQTRPLEALFTPQVSSPSFTHTCLRWWRRLRATCSTGAVTVHTCTYTTWATTAPKLWSGHRGWGEMRTYQSKTSPLDATGPHPASMSRIVCIQTAGQSNWM